MARHSCTRRFAFTMVELVAAMGIFVTLVSVLGGTFYVAQRGYTQLQDRSTSVAQARRLTDIAADDLLRALSISVDSDTLTQFEIPDETGDNWPEIIRYRWETEPGGAVTRQRNDEAPLSLAKSIQRFNIAVWTSAPQPSGGMRDVIVRDHLGYPPDAGSYQISSFVVTDAQYPAQGMQFSQVPVAGTLTISQVRFRARRSAVAATGFLHLELRRADPFSLLPTGALLAKRSVDAGRLNATTFEWVTVTFDETVSISDGDALYIVFRGETGGAATLQYDRLLASTGPIEETWMLWTEDAATSWSPGPWAWDENDLKIVVRGRLPTGEALPARMAEAADWRSAGITASLVENPDGLVYREVPLSAAREGP